MDCIVIGKGRAGAARVRTIEEHPACFLARYVSGRDFHRPQSQNQTLYFVCTENKKHYAMVKTILEHGHHVAVEFPPCMTQAEWMVLTSLANTKKLILHCGLIGLYTSAHKHRKQWLQENQAEEIRVEFSGGLYRWVQEEADFGHVPQLAFGRVATLWDLVGPLEPTKAILEKNPHCYTFTLHAKGEAGEIVTLRERRERGMKRECVWSMMGDVASYCPIDRKREDLFAMDLDRILHKVPSDVPISDIFSLLDRVHAMTYGESQ